ncbi:MAG: MFS transporter [Candidatus Marinimicrobia bacterium]|nr:MFS transporter [Candidatus Neomarinimicrobiota bacterium]
MNNKQRVFWAACTGMMLFGIVMISLGTINTFLANKLALDGLTIASLAALLPFGILTGSLVFGPVVDRYGYKIVLISCALLILIAIEGIAFASNFFFIQLSFFMIGFGGGAINGSTNALVADISAENKGARLSLLGVFYGIGALGMPMILGLMSRYFSYNSVVKVIGGFVLLPAIYFSVIRFPEPKHKQGFPLKESINLLREKTLILIGFVLFFESGIEGIVNNWTTTYLQKSIQAEPKNALFALSSLVIALSLTRLALGDLLKRIRPYLVLFGCLFFIAIGSIVMMVSATYIPSVFGLIFMGIGFAAGFPVMLGYVSDLYPDFSGTAFSIVFVIALLGNTIINYLVGIIAHNFGIHHYLTVILISVIAMFILLSIVLKQIKETIKI